MDKNKVLVGMSGGVDSSVSALLLKEKGYDVTGVMINFKWNGPGEDVNDAKRVAEMLDIPFFVYDFAPGFRNNVIEPFIDSYLCGITPNPCTICNRMCKWKALTLAARSRDAYYVATGHYAFVIQLPNGRYTVKNADQTGKDQSYVLYNLTQEQLSHTIFPIGAYTKDEIRAIAEKAGLPVAHKHDSQDICFIPDNDYAAFLRREAPGRIPPKGNFISETGQVLGEHRGIHCYTLGQRKGLGIALGKPVFVSRIDPKTNEVTLGDESLVFTNTVTADNINYMGETAFLPDKLYYAKTRYSHKATPCHISTISDSQIKVFFESPVRAATPGQAIVLYDGDYVAGGARIILSNGSD
ncbi:MAG: tRNA 2-thiouridine(34) synthase MnmA [Lachnospiraceae bacterium]|nr:tRNA 2-thiouridine(34) synthase MnmA [Lachnospiraceae bacterium]